MVLARVSGGGADDRRAGVGVRSLAWALVAVMIAMTSPADASEASALSAGALGSEALTHGKLYALRVIGDIERTLLRLEQIAPDYDEAAASRALGRLY